MTKIYLVRHGQTHFNKYERMQGWCDSPLTSTGIQDAQKCGRALADIPFNSVYSSDSGRAIHTAELIMETLGLNTADLNKRSALRETFFGSFEGELASVAWTQAAQKKGFETAEEMLQTLSMEEITDSFYEADPEKEAESFTAFLKRYLEGLNQILQTNSSDEHILVVTHGNSIRSIVHHLAPEIEVGVDITNGSVTTLECKDGQLKLLTFNQATNS